MDVTPGCLEDTNMHDHVDERQARYTRMDQGTVEDYALLAP